MAKSDARRYWLFKSEPEVYSFADLLAEPEQRTFWNGIRNYQARNLLRDDVQAGDGVLFYHSNADPLAIAGIAEVVKAGYPDHTAWAAGTDYFDPDSDPAEPTWFMVDIVAVAPFDPPVPRERLMQEASLADMMLLKRGARLSVQPVTKAQWQIILKLAGVREGKR